MISAFDIQSAWESHKVKYGRYYADATEENFRFSLFQNSVAKMLEHNSQPDVTHKLGLNQFSDLTREEFSTRLMKNYQFQQQKRSLSEDQVEDNFDGLFECPEEFIPDENGIPEEWLDHLDWSDPASNPAGRSGVVPIKYQGFCGSGHVFAAVSAIESNLCRTGAYDCESWVGLSEQQIINCGSHMTDEWSDYFGLDGSEGQPANEVRPYYATFGCYGGWASNNIQHIYNAGGITCEHMMPYFSGNSTLKNEVGANWFGGTECPYDASSQYDWILETSHGYVNKKICGTTSKRGKKDADEIKAAVYEKGSLAVSISIGNWFGDYESGVFNPDQMQCNSTTYSDHAVNIVGYGVETYENGEKIPYWKVRNSWSADWGEDGYFRIIRGIDACNIESEVVYAIAENDYEILQPQDYDEPEDGPEDTSGVVVFSTMSLLLAYLLN